MRAPSGGGGSEMEPALWVDVFNPDDDNAATCGADVLRALVAVDCECFLEPRHRTLAALLHSPQLRRATKLIVAWEGKCHAAPETVEHKCRGASTVEAAAASSPASREQVLATTLSSRSNPLPDTPNPVGFVAYVAGSMEFSITKVAVAPVARRRGLAEAMTRAAVAAARRRGAQVVRLRVETTGAAARGLYRKVGFHEETDRPPSLDFYGPGRHALHLALHLSRNM
jgi:ribosomal protein S18 acetylase RimI-like enzyme